MKENILITYSVTFLSYYAWSFDAVPCQDGVSQNNPKTFTGEIVIPQ